MNQGKVATRNSPSTISFIITVSIPYESGKSGHTYDELEEQSYASCINPL